MILTKNQVKARVSLCFSLRNPLMNAPVELLNYSGKPCPENCDILQGTDCSRALCCSLRFIWTWQDFGCDLQLAEKEKVWWFYTHFWCKISGNLHSCDKWMWISNWSQQLWNPGTPIPSNKLPHNWVERRQSSINFGAQRSFCYNGATTSRWMGAGAAGFHEWSMEKGHRIEAI